MTSFRIESLASRRLKICEPPDWSRRNLDRPSGRLGGRSFDGNNFVVFDCLARLTGGRPQSRVGPAVELPPLVGCHSAFALMAMPKPPDCGGTCSVAIVTVVGFHCKGVYDAAFASRRITSL
jgi:hypothetical protein